jgi:hypothetical protein
MRLFNPAARRLAAKSWLDRYRGNKDRLLQAFRAHRQ